MFRKTLYLLTLHAFVSTAVFGGVIASVSGPASTGITISSISGSEQFLTTNWTQTSSFSDVSISAVLGHTFNVANPVASGSAYLTNQIGSGTNAVANQIASAAWSITTQGYSSITLFTGLNLGQGNYFLVLVADSGQSTAWISTNTPTTDVAPGGAVGPDRFVNSTSGVFNFAYPPASTFATTPAPFEPTHLLFTVTVTAPEPATALLCAAAVIALLVLNRLNLIGTKSL